MKFKTGFYHLNLFLLMKNMKLGLKKGMRKFKAFYFIAPLKSIIKNKSFHYIKFQITYKISVYEFKVITLKLNHKNKNILF